MELNLGGGDSLTNAIVKGPGVIPASPDSRFHNAAPLYPERAAALGEQGAVVIMIHVAPDGSVASVDVEQSSGYPLLDQAAVKAIRGWHFLPAMRDGSGVPSEMPMRVVFQAS